ncbi:MAG TPA: hypothetical protein VE712_05495 [Actinomycetota bacterium]|nr:hypothetical protein [Actinomycetota bacterium]
MARLRRRTGVLWVVGVVACVLYLVVVDVGISAGRIHHGVSVDGIELGGLTAAEAEARLRSRAVELKEAPVDLVGHGLDRSVLPTDLGWRPRPDRTARSAMQLGRAGGPWSALWDRLRAWVGGVSLPWAGGPDAQAMVAYVKDVDRDAAELGLEVNRARLRRQLRTSFSRWPRARVTVPLKS